MLGLANSDFWQKILWILKSNIDRILFISNKKKWDRKFEYLEKVDLPIKITYKDLKQNMINYYLLTFLLLFLNSYWDPVCANSLDGNIWDFETYSYSVIRNCIILRQNCWTRIADLVCIMTFFPRSVELYNFGAKSAKFTFQFKQHSRLLVLVNFLYILQILMVQILMGFFTHYTENLDFLLLQFN